MVYSERHLNEDTNLTAKRYLISATSF